MLGGSTFAKGTLPRSLERSHVRGEPPDTFLRTWLLRFAAAALRQGRSGERRYVRSGDWDAGSHEHGWDGRKPNRGQGHAQGIEHLPNIISVCSRPTVKKWVILNVAKDPKRPARHALSGNYFWQML
jgi:hypothetical protein